MRNILGRKARELIGIRENRFYYRAAGKLLRFKPVLSYLEIHLVDHCNLNCSGCSHCSPLAHEFFANIEQYKRDMKQLKTLLGNIKEIHLLGGEPLLHPDVNKFLDATKTWFPEAKINLATNGILLHSMSEEFWDTCTRNSVAIDITLYPPCFDKESTIRQLAKEKGIRITLVKRSKFFVTTNSKGNSDINKCFKYCQGWVYCPILEQGKIYRCSRPAFWRFFNKAFGTEIPDTGFVDIYDPKMTGWKVISQINRSSEACRYCTLGLVGPPTQIWSKSECNRKEWDVASQTS